MGCPQQGPGLAASLPLFLPAPHSVLGKRGGVWELFVGPKERQGAEGDAPHSGGSGGSGRPPGGQGGSGASAAGTAGVRGGVRWGTGNPRGCLPSSWCRQAGLPDSGPEGGPGTRSRSGARRKGGQVLLACVPECGRRDRELESPEKAERPPQGPGVGGWLFSFCSDFYI